jgi:hypothetical protein
MGHERVGILPRTKEWRRLVDGIAQTAGTPELIPVLVSDTLSRVRVRFENVHADPGFQAAFRFLLGLATTRASIGSSPSAFPAFDLQANPSPLRLTADLQAWVDAHAVSLEYADLATRAAADAILFWTAKRTGQEDLFPQASTASQVWADARNGAAFSEIARVFFGKFLERYVNYFLDREASARLPNVEARARFALSVARHVDQLATHAFETTKIAQSFAAGWFNKNARSHRPNEVAIEAFLAFATGKLRQELQRESATA